MCLLNILSSRGNGCQRIIIMHTNNSAHITSTWQRDLQQQRTAVHGSMSENLQQARYSETEKIQQDFL